VSRTERVYAEIVAKPPLQMQNAALNTRARTLSSKNLTMQAQAPITPILPPAECWEYEDLRAGLLSHKNANSRSGAATQVLGNLLRIESNELKEALSQELSRSSERSNYVASFDAAGRVLGQCFARSAGILWDALKVIISIVV